MSSDYSSWIRSRFGTGDEAATVDAVADNAFLRQILARRTHRRYLSTPVPENLIDVLAATALSASSKSDFQQASIIRVADPGKRAELAALVPSMPWIGTAPAFLVFCGDARRLEKIGTLRGHPESNAGLEGFFNATVDAALALQTFILAAESASLGCCPISVLRNHADVVAKILGLPDKVFPVAGLCVGFPDGAGWVGLRLPRALTLHTDTYDDSQFAAAIDAYDRERDQRAPITTDKQRDPGRFGFAEFYGWSEDKARQAASAEGQAFPPYLRRSGFTFD